MNIYEKQLIYAALIQLLTGLKFDTKEKADKITDLIDRLAKDGNLQVQIDRNGN